MTTDNDDDVEQLAKAIETLVHTAQNESVVSKKEQEFNETINTLTNSISTMFDNENIGGRLNTIEKDLTAIMKHLDREDRERLPSLTRELTSIKSDVACLKKGTLAITNANAPSLKHELASNKRDFASLKGNIANTNVQLSSFKSELTSINNNIKKFKGKITNINEQLPSFKRELTSTKSGVCTLQDKITNINNHIPDLNRKLLSTKTEVANLKGKIDNINGHLPGFKRDFTAIQNNFAALNTQITKINEFLESQFGMSKQEQSTFAKELPSSQQFEVMLSGADIGSFEFCKRPQPWRSSSDLVRPIIKRFSVGLGFVIGKEDYCEYNIHGCNKDIQGNHSCVSRKEFVDKLLRHLHKVTGQKPRLVEDDDFDTIYYS